jgi:hypothetical protein
MRVLYSDRTQNMETYLRFLRRCNWSKRGSKGTAVTYLGSTTGLSPSGKEWGLEVDKTVDVWRQMMQRQRWQSFIVSVPAPGLPNIRGIRRLCDSTQSAA